MGTQRTISALTRSLPTCFALGNFLGITISDDPDELVQVTAVVPPAEGA